jgi:Icc protein
MRLAWVTDPHFEFVQGGDMRAARAFGVAIREEHRSPDALLVTGDVGHCDTFAGLLDALAEGFGRPVYFVLGNHDYYRGSFSRAHAQAGALSGLARWLSSRGPVPLGSRTILVGRDGFYDARAGDALGSNLFLNDFVLIEDLRLGSLPALVDRLRDLGVQQAADAERCLRSAAAGSSEIVFATHCPPFVEASFHESGLSDADAAPWFTCVAMGEALRRVAGEHPDVSFLVLCGHTHTGGEVEILENLRVTTGGAEYGHPRVERILEFDSPDLTVPDPAV